MFASIHWMAWKEEMGFPNCWRSWANFRAASKAALPIPRAWAAMPILPPSRVISAIL